MRLEGDEARTYAEIDLGHPVRMAWEDTMDKNTEALVRVSEVLEKLLTAIERYRSAENAVRVVHVGGGR